MDSRAPLEVAYQASALRTTGLLTGRATRGVYPEQSRREIRIVRFEQFAQGVTKNIPKSDSFLLIFTNFLLIFANFYEFLRIFPIFFSRLAHLIRKPARLMRKFNAFANKLARLI